MSSQVISYRLSTDEVLALRTKALPGESDNQTAQRLMREALGVSTASTEFRQVSTSSLDERIEDIVEERLASFTANQGELLTSLQERLQRLESRLEAVVAVPELVPDELNIVDSVDKLVDNSDRFLSQGDLAKRLRTHTGTLTKNRTKPNFTEWSRGKDPEGLAWQYLPEIERYSPVSTELSTSVNGSSWEAQVDEVVGGLSYAE